MRNADEEKKIQSRIKNGMRERKGRLFVAESDKPAAVSALAALLAESCETFVCVVRDADVAEDFSYVFKCKKIETTIISSCDQLASLLAGIGANEREKDSRLRALAPKLPKVYPHLIVTAEESAGNGALFHKKLTKDTTKKGTFATSEESAPFCVSDFIACAGYGFALVDDIYGMLDFYEAEQEAPNPLEAECFDFLGVRYFADIAHSHKRLKAVVQSCGQAVLLSDYVIKDRILPFYAALDLLDDGVSLAEEERKLAALSPDYMDYCDEVNMNILFSKSDESNVMTSRLMELLIDCKQKVPRSREDLKKYISNRLVYCSYYELYIKSVAPFVGKSLEATIDRLFNNPLETANCFMKLFFEDMLKGEIESSVSSAHVSELSSKEMNALLGIFSRYGIYRSCETPQAVTVLEMYRDNSGYEAYLEGWRTKENENRHAAAVEDGSVDRIFYSAIREGSDLMYECALLQQLVEEGGSGKQLDFPVLVVTREDKREFVRILEKIMPQVKASVDYCDVSNATTNGISVVVTDFERVAKGARSGNMRSALCLGILADPLCERALLQKLAVPAVVAVRYGDMSLGLSDFWRDVVFGKTYGTMLPVGVGEISLKPGRFEDYSDVVKRIGEVYGLLVSLANSRGGGGSAEITKQLNMLIREFSTDNVLNAEEIGRELEFLSRASKNYNIIFENSVSYGREGEKVLCMDYGNPTKPREIEKERVVLFEVCAKLLRRACDTTKLECGTCGQYGKYRKNSLISFCNGVRNFLKDSMDYAKKADEFRVARAKNAGLSFFDEEERAITVDFVAAETEKAEKILREIEKAGEKFNGTFAYSAASIQQLKTIVTAIFGRAANPCFERLTKMFCEASHRVTVRKSGITGEGYGIN